MCLPCWERGGFSRDGWVIDRKEHDLSHFYTSLGFAYENLDRLEKLLDDTSDNIREEIAIRQMREVEAIVSDVLQKYEPEVEAIKAAIAAARRHIDALSKDADDFAA